MVNAQSREAAGAIWRLDISQRQLDANVIYIQPDDRIETHIGPDLDVLMHVLGGTGQIAAGAHSMALQAGALVWLPRRSQRSITAGPAGLRYLTVHVKRPGLRIDTAHNHDAAE